MRKKLFFAILFLFSLSLTSCLKSDYRRARREWTSKSNIYSAETFDAKIMWSATYLSSDFREAAREQISEWKKLNPDQFGTYASYIQENDQGSFIVSIYLPRDYPLITAEADNFWQFTLELPSGESIPPSSIESISVTRREERLFHYVNPWSNLYRVKFPVVSLVKPFKLALRSAATTSFLDWNK